MKYKKITRPVKHKFVMTSEELDQLIGVFDRYRELRRSMLPLNSEHERNLSPSEAELYDAFRRAYNGGF